MFGYAGGEVGERIGEVGETMSGTGDNSRFSKLGLRLGKYVDIGASAPL